MCGEKAVTMSENSPKKGSPPRVRGEAGCDGNAFTESRITPACAGRRSDSDVAASRRKDHPRVCGEKKTDWTEIFGPGGSPPRVRGEAFPFCDYSISLRITPACAGRSRIDIHSLDQG